MTDNFDVEISIPLSELEQLLRDQEFRDLVDSCNGEGSCVAEALLERLVERYSPIQPSSMEEWIATDPNEDDPENCRPCRIPIVVQWYCDELTEADLPAEAEELEQVALNDDPLTVAAKLDTIKASVSGQLKDRLAEFDATTQANS